jgi:hypothetical protein
MYPQFNSTNFTDFANVNVFVHRFRLYTHGDQKPLVKRIRVLSYKIF